MIALNFVTKLGEAEYAGVEKCGVIQLAADCSVGKRDKPAGYGQPRVILATRSVTASSALFFSPRGAAHYLLIGAVVDTSVH